MSAGYILVQPESSPKPSPSAKEAPLSNMSWSRQQAMMTISRIITAIGNFSIQYNFQAISVSLITMSVEQCTLTEEQCKDGNQAGWVMGTATATVFAGAILGQLTMGYVGDILDRNKAMTLTLSIAALAAVCSAVLPRGSPTDVYITIIICRFILGAGLGGVYPLSAAKAAEDAPPEEREEVYDPEAFSIKIDSEASTPTSTSGKGYSFKTSTRRSAMAFFWQIPGSLTPWALAYLFSFLSLSVDTQWRLLLGLGSIPAALVVLLLVVEMNYSEPKALPENQQTSQSEKSSRVLASEKLTAIFHAAFRDKVIWFKVFYTGGSWFLYDVCFYGVGLFGGEIVASISPRKSDSVASSTSLRSTSLKQVFALSLGIPACAITIMLLKSLGTKRIQTLGFVFVAFSFTLIASIYENCRKEHPNVLYCVYCMLLLSLSGGPILTTFILPAETFPKEIRATFSGIAAACGKLGAFVGAYLFGPLASATSFPFVMALCALLASLGALLSHICIGAEHSPIPIYGNPLNPELSSASDYTLSLMHSQGPHNGSITPLSPGESVSLQTGGTRPNSKYRTISVADAEVNVEALEIKI